MRIFLVLCFTLLLTSCGSNEKTGNDDLRTESDVVDVRLSEANATTPQTSEPETWVGFDANGKESRLLVHFPGLLKLWDEAVVVSSIAEVIFNLSCSEVAANPESIELVPISKPWNPLATWKSPTGILPGNPWSTPGGDVDPAAAAITPAVRAHPKVAGAFELQFDLTGLVRAMILEGRKNYGFQIRVRKSEHNAIDQMSFKTVNHDNEGLRPTSVLTYATKEGISP